MKRLFLFFSFVLSVLFLSAQTVSNVVARQVGNMVEITYYLDQTASVRLLMSQDGGSTYSYIPKSVSGDIGSNVPPGQRKIVWNMLNDAQEWNIQQARFKIIAIEGNKLPFIVNGVSFKMIKVEGGTFTMGCTSEQGGECDSDEKPAHQVTLSEYYIGETEVTQALWKAVMGTTISQQRDKANPSWPFRGVGDDYPMYYISWDECKVFVDKLNSLLSSQLNGKHFALPTEAQWEYAARGGNKSKRYKYSGSNSIGNVAWYDGNSSNSTHAVGAKYANELGLYDMSGNVYEWCKDWYGSYSSGSQTNPTGPSSGSSRVYRGGSWNYFARNCRVSYRFYYSPVNRFSDLGLRVVLY